jgi:hypothetical protein
MYISDLGAVVGSANASFNGIGYKSQPARYEELAVFLPPGSPEFEKAKLHFDMLFSTARSSDEAINIANNLYRRNRMAVGVKENFKIDSMLDRVRVDPAVFGKIGFVFNSERAQDSEKKKGADEVIAELSKLEYKGSVTYIFEEWKNKEIENWPKNFVNFHLTKNTIYIDAYEVLIKNESEKRVRVQKCWQDLFGEGKGLRFNKKSVATIDTGLAGQIWDKLKEQGRVFHSANELHVFILGEGL